MGADPTGNIFFSSQNRCYLNIDFIQMSMIYCMTFCNLTLWDKNIYDNLECIRMQKIYQDIYKKLFTNKTIQHFKYLR